MPSFFGPEAQHYLLPVAGAVILLIVLMRVPFVGRVIQVLFSVALIAVAAVLITERAPMDPSLSAIAGRLGLDRQEVVGEEVRIRMATNGHFMANVTVNGVKRRMLIDSGATVTTLSEGTAAAAKVDTSKSLAPVVLRTANGLAPARSGAVETLRLGSIAARDLKVVVTPGIGDMDVIGMNFLSKLQSWRVEGRTLVLVPKEA